MSALEDGKAIEKAKSLLSEILLSVRITGADIEKYIRKAIRYNVWRLLPDERRIFLILARRKRSFTSKLISEAIRSSLIEIESLTLRGKALIHGIILKFKEMIFGIGKKEVEREKDIILALGISHLNAPSLGYVLG
ncbi:hypothetical protein IOK49_03925 [Fervidicoccus fontis]|uniref:Uncharacterized protein n=1 Tax=Fervidicoccus fontis TaxID=683846 RepID=A0A843A8Q2_9CREN|nr:hypothetical protein [Fervidicoccus fontis]MBE9391223.1 hypothetical protein [Fervidicoccus fontis]